MKTQSNTADQQGDNQIISPVRVRHWNYDADEQEDGTVIDQTKTHYVVVPDDDIMPPVRWYKKDCEVLR